MIYIWNETFYHLDSDHLNELDKGIYHAKRTLDGREIYILKKGYENIPQQILDAFQNLSRLDYQNFQKLAVSCQIRHRRLDNLRKLLPEDILGLITGHMDESTKVAYALACHPMMRAAAKPDLKKICQNAANDGHLGLLKWARSKGAPWGSDTCTYAAFGGHLELLKWACENGVPWNSLTYTSAADGGHLEVLKWIFKNKPYFFNMSILEESAKKGHLEVIKWAREIGYKWRAHDKTCSNAASGGHLEVLKWAKEDGAPYDLEDLLHHGQHHKNILDWLEANLIYE